MGRETQALVTFRGVTAEAKVLLESTELILRGAIKARLPRAGLSDISPRADGLWLVSQGEPLHVVLPEVEAVRWAKAILTPPPSLASKLGIGPNQPAIVIGAMNDPTLCAALEGAITHDPASASAVIAIIEDHAALATVLADAKALPVWCVYPKGKAADPGDTAIRTAFRGAGWMDNKACAVSARFTATRYTKR